jgi:hypothetical protein
MATRALAFYFAAETEARPVLERLLNGLGFTESHLGVAPLVIDRVEGTVLAITAGAEKVDSIVALAEQHGGWLVADVLESATHDRRP